MALSCQGDSTIMSVILNKLTTDKQEVMNIMCMQGRNEETGLMYASNNGHSTILKLCLYFLPPSQRHKLLSMGDKDGRNALYYAASNGHVQSVKTILQSVTESERIALVGSADNYKWTSLHIAAHGGHHNFVIELLNGLNAKKRLELLKLKEAKGWNPLHFAALHGRHETVSLILSSLDECDRLNYLLEKENSQTALHLACQQGHSSVIEAILNHVKDSEIVDFILEREDDGWTSLALSVHLKMSPDTLRCVIDYIPAAKRFQSLCVSSNKGWNTLHRAVADGSPDVVTAIIELLDMDNMQRLLFAKTHDGSTSLLLAAQHNHFHTAKILLHYIEPAARWGYIKEKSKADQTAIHKSAYHGFHETLAVLLANIHSQKTDRWYLVEEPTGKAFSPLQCAVLSGDTCSVDLIMQFFSAEERLPFILEKSSSGLTLAHYAALAMFNKQQKYPGKQLPTDVIQANKRSIDNVMKYVPSNQQKAYLAVRNNENYLAEELANGKYDGKKYKTLLGWIC